MNMELIIDGCFKRLIPPLSEDELQQLEQNILAEGCRDAIIVWKGRIADGYNRYAICKKHNIPFQVKVLRLTSRGAVTLWIIDNQLGRRNLTDANRIELAIQRAEILRQQGPISRRKAIAKTAGVSENTVHKYLTIKKLADPELLAKVNSGEEKIGTAYKGLQLTTTVVEKLCTDAQLQEINRNNLPAILSNCVQSVDKLYDFMMDIPTEDGDSAVYNMLCGHMGVLGLVQ